MWHLERQVWRCVKGEKVIVGIREGGERGVTTSFGNVEVVGILTKDCFGLIGWVSLRMGGGHVEAHFNTSDP